MSPNVTQEAWEKLCSLGEEIRRTPMPTEAQLAASEEAWEQYQKLLQEEEQQLQAQLREARAATNVRGRWYRRLRYFAKGR